MATHNIDTITPGSHPAAVPAAQSQFPTTPAEPAALAGPRQWYLSSGQDEEQERMLEIKLLPSGFPDNLAAWCPPVRFFSH